MRKLTYGLVVFVLLVSGCQSKTKSTTVCTIAQDEMKVTLTLDAEGDTITKLTQQATTDLQTSFDQGLLNEDSVKQSADAVKEKLSKLKGASYKYTLKKTTLDETSVFDLTKADIDELIDAKILEIEGSTEKGLSLKKSVANYKEQGLTCKTK